MDSPAFRLSYKEHVDQLTSRLDRDQAFRLAVGGEFIAVGKLEYHLLRALGLSDGHLVVDVGCGSGRLAVQLAPFPGIGYVGCDIEPRLLAYAAELSRRPDWEFVSTGGNGVPCAPERADFVCFFSVFTHLPHEATFEYVADAYRALKPGGILVCSFLEFRIRCHWTVFASSIGRFRCHERGLPLDQFLSRDAIEAMAENVGFQVQQIWDGDKPHIPIPEEITWENGTRMGSMGNLGQSVAVLRKAG
jgi:SAM-dependent methyltransferase